MTLQEVNAKIQELEAQRDEVVQDYQDQVNKLVRAANLYVQATNAHIDTLKMFATEQVLATELGQETFNDSPTQNTASRNSSGRDDTYSACQCSSS